MTMMIMMCFLVIKGPLTQLAPLEGGGATNYDDGYDSDNDDDDDDDSNGDDDDDVFSKNVFL